MDSQVEVLVSQLETVLVFLERPVVQRQLLALAIIFWVSGALSTISSRIAGRWFPFRKDADDSRLSNLLRRIRRASGHALYWPVFTCILILFVGMLFISLEFPAGMLLSALLLAIAWWLYRVGIFVLTLLFGRRTVEPLRKRILLPGFLLALGLILLSRLASLPLLASIELFSVLGSSITLGRLLGALLVLYLFVVLAWLTQSGLVQILERRLDVNRGVVQSVVTIMRYAVIAMGLLFALSIMGLDLSTLTIVGGGISVGIGIGLKDFLANIVSGLLLTFEQALRPGDVIDIDGEIGVVQRLNLRSTIVRTLDNVELVVPNQHFSNSRVRTYTKTSRQVRLQLPVGVSYGSDPHLVRDLMLATAKRHGLVLDEPAPTVFFRGFGDSSLDFYLAVWLEQPDRIPRLRSDLYFMMWDAFKEHGVEIPFPQRDLHLRTGWEGLRPPVEPEGEGDAGPTGG